MIFIRTSVINIHIIIFILGVVLYLAYGVYHSRENNKNNNGEISVIISRNSSKRPVLQNNS